LKFAQYSKSDSVAKVDSSQAVNSLNCDLCSLAAWSEEWLLFNIDKCGVMHFGYNNKKDKCVLGGQDLGILVQNDLKVYQQCCQAANNRNTILGIINRAFTLKSKSIILLLYKSLVTPHLDYAIPA